MKNGLRFLLTGLQFLIASLCIGQSIYVDKSATGANNGTSWANAYTNLDTALRRTDTLSLADTIKIAAGFYYPSVIPKFATSSDPRDRSFSIPKMSIVLGGYPSGGGDRNPQLNKTILSGDLGIQGDSTDNAYHVVLIWGDDISMDGFHIERGHANGTGFLALRGIAFNRNSGGGIIIANSNTNLVSCTIERNSALNSGGGISSNGSRLTMENCTLFANSSNFNMGSPVGGGLYINSSRVGTNIKNTIFIDNRTLIYGGAIHVRSSPNLVVLDSCYFRFNHAMSISSADAGGGAIQAMSGSNITIYRSVFDSNSARFGGAIMLANDVFNYTVSCVFKSNWASLDGGAIAATSAIKADIGNSLFIDNHTGRYGGAVANNRNAKVVYCSFIKNKADTYGGGVYASGIQFTSANSVYWRNASAGIENVDGSDIVDGSAMASYNNSFQYYTNGDPNSDNLLGVPPGFVDTTNAKGTDGLWRTADDGFNLKATSGLVDKANPTTEINFFNEKDITYQSRIICGDPDIGAYERQTCDAVQNHVAYVDHTATGDNSGDSWSNAFQDISTALAAMPAFDIDTIKVAKGVYFHQTPGLDLPSNIVILGGYPNGGGDRNYVTNPTILTADYQAVLLLNIDSRTNVTIDGLILEKSNHWDVASALKIVNSSVIIRNTTIRDCAGNSAIYLEGSTGNFINCIISENNCPASPIFNKNSPVKYVNCLFSKNRNEGTGGGVIWIRDGGMPSFINCTFYKNYSFDVGVIFSFDPTPIIQNCIFWGNMSRYNEDGHATDGNELLTDYTPGNISNSIFEFPLASLPSNTLIGQYPQFVDTVNIMGMDNVHGTPDDGLMLADSSLAINRGSNNFLPPDIIYDITNRSRILQGVVDLGAYESDHADTINIINACPPQTSIPILSNITGNSYQWQVDSGSGFANLSNSSNYSGVNDSILFLNNVNSGSYNHKYRCVVDGQSSELYKVKFSNTWTGAVNSVWENPANWSCGVVPDTNSNVVINAGSVVVINSNITVGTLILNPGSNLTVNSGFILTILH